MKKHAFAGLFAISACLGLAWLTAGRVAQGQVVQDQAAEGQSSAVADGLKDWPMYNCDEQGTRHNVGEHTLGPQNASRLIEKWRYPREGSGQRIGIIRATPIVVNGYVYFGTSTNPAFYKLTPSGKLKWSYRASALPGQRPGGAIYGSALVTGDAVYFADTSGYIYSLDRQTGKQRWRVDMRAAGFPAAHELNGTYSSPILAGDLIVLGGGAGEQGISLAVPDYPCCTGRGFVVAMRPESGKIVWTYIVGPKPQRLSPSVTITDAWGDHVFYYAPSTSTVWSTPSYDPDSGTVFFGTDTNNSPRRPTPDDPRSDTPESCAVIAVDARSGREKWVTQLNPGDVWNMSMRAYDPKRGQYLDLSIGDTPKVYTIMQEGRGRRVVGVGCKDGAFYVLDATTGRVLHHTPKYTGPPSHPANPAPDPRTIALPSPAGGIQTGCAVDGRSVYANGSDQIQLRTLEQPDGSYHIPPTAGRVVSISLDAQSEHWRHERPKYTVQSAQDPARVYRHVGDPVASGIAVAGGVVYFTGTVSQQLVALSAENGRLLTSIRVGPVWSGPSVSRGRVYVGTGLYGIVDSPEIRRFTQPFFAIQDHGVLWSFGLPGEDEADRMGDGEE